MLQKQLLTSDLNLLAGGLWKNRNANLKKKVGSGPGGKKGSGADDVLTMLDQLDNGLTLSDGEED